MVAVVAVRKRVVLVAVVAVRKRVVLVAVVAVSAVAGKRGVSLARGRAQAKAVENTRKR
jgi:hypothetical protein